MFLRWELHSDSGDKGDWGLSLVARVLCEWRYQQIIQSINKLNTL